MFHFTYKELQRIIIGNEDKDESAILMMLIESYT